MTARSKLFGIIAIAILFLFIFVKSCSDSPESQKPKLILMIVVDQFAYEYIDRFQSLFRGGLKRLLNQSVQYTKMESEHANTSTCPGHASLVSGVHPQKHGIIDNYWFDRKSGKNTYCVSDSVYERSPKRIKVTSLPDWIKDKSRRAKVYSVSQKDRSAIILGGKEADGAYWYDETNGNFISSSYYSNNNPKWLKDFNLKGSKNKFFGKPWKENRRIAKLNYKKFQIQSPDRGDFPDTFPHALGDLSLTPNQSYYKDLYNSPLSDLLVTELAKKLITAEKLGNDSVTDYLALSYSALDTVGHKYGPNSPEVLDVILKLDLQLNKLFDFLDKTIGMQNIAIALTSDHGIQKLPEYQNKHGVKAKRMTTKDIKCMQSLTKKINKKFKTRNLILAHQILNKELLKENDISEHALMNFIKKELGTCENIAAVWTKSEIIAAPEDSLLYRYKLNYHHQISPDFVVQYKKDFLPVKISGTNHGSPYDYDTHVPAFIMAPNFDKKIVRQPVSTIDLAPTLATLADVKIYHRIQGRSLLPAID